MLSDDSHVSRMDVLVLLDEVSADDGSKQFWRVDWVLFCEDVNSVLDRIRSHNDAVIGLGVSVQR